MNLARIFAHAFVRRLAYVAVAALLACVGIGSARADGHAYKPQAYSHCEQTKNVSGIYAARCTDLSPAEPAYYTEFQNVEGGLWYNAGLSYYHYWGAECPPDSAWNPATNTCVPTNCAGQPPLSGGYLVDPANGTGTFASCKGSCAYMDPDSEIAFWQIDGVTFVSVDGWVPTGEMCTVDDEHGEKPVDTDNDGVSDENDDFPDDPNESSDSDNDGIGDNGDHSPDDPTDGADGPGDEDGDDEGDNIAHGGGDCNTPPICSGDGIQCAQLRTQWMIMCKGAKVTGSPEVCNASYTCTGDSAQCALIAVTRKTACAGVVTGGTEAQELLDGLKNGPADQGDGTGPIWIADDSSVEADDSGFGLARSCPPAPTIYGKTLPPAYCDIGTVIAALILLAGFVQFGYAFTRS